MMTSTIDWAFVAFVGMVLFILAFMLIVPQLLGGRSWAPAKQQPFESGIVSVGGARIRLSAKFYLVAIFFVLFDIEALYLFAWATSARELGWMGYIEVVIFILVLLAGLVYIARIGALDWSPKDRNNLSQSSVPQGGVGSKGINLAGVTAFNGIAELETDRLGKVPAQLSGEMHTPAKDTVAEDK